LNETEIYVTRFPFGRLLLWLPGLDASEMDRLGDAENSSCYRSACPGNVQHKEWYLRWKRAKNTMAGKSCKEKCAEKH